MCDKSIFEHVILVIEDYVFHLYCHKSELPKPFADSSDEIPRLYKESGGNWKKMPSPYQARLDPPHDAKTGQPHIHVLRRKKELCAINRDGTGHDGSTGYRIPLKVYNELVRSFPDFNIPSDRTIASIGVGGKIFKFSEYASIRVGDADAMRSLNIVIAMIEDYEGRAFGGNTR